MMSKVIYCLLKESKKRHLIDSWLMTPILVYQVS